MGEEGGVSGVYYKIPGVQNESWWLYAHGELLKSKGKVGLVFRAGWDICSE